MTVYDLKIEQGFYSPVCSIYRWTGSSWVFQKTIERVSISSEVQPVGGFMTDASDVLWLDNCTEPPKAVLYVQGQTVLGEPIRLGTQAIDILGNQSGRVAIRYPGKIVLYKSGPKGKDSYFNGNLAEAVLINKCMPANDIFTILCNYGGPGNLANAYRPFLYGYWRFGNIQNKRIPDLSGKGHDISYKSVIKVYNISFPAQEPIPSVFEIVPRFYRFSLNNMSFNKSGTLTILIKHGNQVVTTETLSYIKRTVLTRTTIDLSSNTMYSYEVYVTTSQNKTGGRTGTVRTNVIPPDFVGNFTVTSFARRIIFNDIAATQPGSLRMYLYTDGGRTNKIYDHIVSFDGSLNEFVISNLTPLTTYYYTVEISNADGESNSQSGSKMTDIPIPAVVTLTIVPSLFDISFNNLTFDHSCSVYIEMYTNYNFSGTPLVSSTASFTTTPLSFAFHGLPSGVQYYYKLIVTNASGEVAEILGSVSTSYLPTFSPGITTAKTFNSITINNVVTDSSGKIEYIYTTNGVSAVQTTNPYTVNTVDSKVITDLAPATVYSVVVRAYPITLPDQYTELSLGNITTDGIFAISKGVYTFTSQGVAPVYYYWTKVMNTKWTCKLTNGNILVVWCAMSSADVSGNYGLYAQVLNPVGAPLLSSDFNIDVDSNNDVLPYIREISANKVAIAYQTIDGEYSTNCNIRIITISGSAITVQGSFLIPLYPTSGIYQWYVTIKMLISIEKLSDNTFWVIWANRLERNWQTGVRQWQWERAWELNYRVYNDTGAIIRGNTQIDTFTTGDNNVEAYNHSMPTIVTSGTNFIFTWERQGATYVRVIDSNYSWVTGAIYAGNVSSSTSTYSFPYSFANAANNRLFVTYQNNTFNDGLDSQIYIRAYDFTGVAINNAILLATIPNDTTMPIKMIETSNRFLFCIPSLATNGDTSIYFISTSKDLSTIYTSYVYPSLNLIMNIGTLVDILDMGTGNLMISVMRSTQLVSTTYTVQVENVILNINSLLV
jgi:hypothetical protein